MKNFQGHWSIQIFPSNSYGPTIGPYEFPQEKAWTNGPQSSLKVSVLTGVGPYPKGPKIEQIQDRPPGLKFSIEIVIFNRDCNFQAGHLPNPCFFFCGEF